MGPYFALLVSSHICFYFPYRYQRNWFLPRRNPQPRQPENRENDPANPQAQNDENQPENLQVSLMQSNLSLLFAKTCRLQL